MKQYKNTVQTIQNTVNTSTRITKKHTHYKTNKYTHPRITKQVKTTTVQTFCWENQCHFLNTKTNRQMSRLQLYFATTVFCLAITAIWPRHTQPQP